MVWMRRTVGLGLGLLLLAVAGSSIGGVLVSATAADSVSSSSSSEEVVTPTTVAAAAAASSSSTNETFHKSKDTNKEEEQEQEQPQLLWYQDIFFLPADVPFPGTGWLDRMAAKVQANQEEPFIWKGIAYDTVYAAILEHSNYHPCRNFNAYLNSIVLPPRLAGSIVLAITNNNLMLGHYVLCYIRNFVGAMLIYYGVALAFSYGCYIWYGNAVFEQQGRTRPSWDIIWHQIKLAQMSLFLYVLLPVMDEYLVEHNWTFAYYTVHDEMVGGGWVGHLACMGLYFAMVEIGIYWMHRTLHTNKWLYKHVHLMHHKYNKPETLTPWASIAFHPLDGMLQASPYVICQFFIPCHYACHVLLLFFTAIWATYIHDAMDWNIDPIMGSKYHTVHHTHYIYNYGQVFTFCDRFWGTLKVPTQPTGLGGKRDNHTKSNDNTMKEKAQ